MGLRERLDALRTEAVPVPLRARGLVQRSVMLNPLVWGAAKAIAMQVRPLTAVACGAFPPTHPNQSTEQGAGQPVRGEGGQPVL
jgi:hypothetical protein